MSTWETKDWLWNIQFELTPQIHKNYKLSETTTHEHSIIQWVLTQFLFWGRQCLHWVIHGWSPHLTIHITNVHTSFMVEQNCVYITARIDGHVSLLFLKPILNHLNQPRWNYCGTNYTIISSVSRIFLYIPNSQLLCRDTCFEYEKV